MSRVDLSDRGGPVDVVLVGGHAEGMLRLRGMTVDCADSDQLAEFWAHALGYERRSSLWEPYAGVKDPGGHGPHVTFQRNAEAPRNRSHLDLYADDPDAEIARLEALGATRVRRVDEGDTWWWVMRDPDDNEFCVIATLGPDRS